MRSAAIVLLGLLAVFVGVNLVDGDLDPATRALYERAPRVFSRDSGWALMLGLDAPPGQDPRAYAKVSRPGEVRPLRPVVRVSSDERLALRAAVELLCAPESMDCVKAFKARPDSIDDMAADNALLLGRYDQLLRAADLADVVHGVDAYEVYFPANLLIAAQRVRLSQVGAAAARGDAERALAWLDADCAFFRRWLEEAQTTLSKMLALRGFTRCVLMAGQVARALALAPAQATSLAKAVAPLSRNERGMSGPMRSEAVLLREMLDQMIASPRAVGEVTGANPYMSEFAARTLRRNSTLAFAAPFFTAWIDVDGIESSALAPRLEAIRAEQKRRMERDWRWLHNYAGRAIVVENSYDPGQYVYRLRDGDALAATVLCVVKLRGARVAREDAAGFVASEPACRDPYTGRPLAWDGSKGELSFKAGWPKHVDRVGGAGGRIGFVAY